MSLLFTTYTMRILTMIFFIVGALTTMRLFAAESPLEPPSTKVIAEAKSIIASMKVKAKGPYDRIVWFCEDGTTQPPKAYACQNRGGGKQHATYSQERTNLSEMGWTVGTILASLSFEDFLDSDHRNLRLRAMPLERYLMDIDDGWILRRAQNYRGRIQIEDEEAAGRKLLLELFQDQNWLDSNYLLLRELFKTIPHGAANDLSRAVRRSAQELAERDSSFESIRIEIHSAPSQKTLDKVRLWRKQYQQKELGDSSVMEGVEVLENQLDSLYGLEGRHQRISLFSHVLAKLKDPVTQMPFNLNFNDSNPLQGISDLSRVFLAIRQELAKKEQRLALKFDLVDIISDLETELRLRVRSYLESPDLTRLNLLQLSEYLVDATYGSGILTVGEWQSTKKSLLHARSNPTLSTDEYLAVSKQINATGAWFVSSVRYHFAEALVYFGAIDHRASTFVDDLLRGSIALQLAEVGRRIGVDAQHAAGIKKELFGKSAPAIMALNPGLARGKLRFLSEIELQANIQPSKNDIVVLTQTVSELAPVAGVLTMGEGNVLSHVQMLARNFGIPNVTLTPRFAEELRGYNGREVVLSAGSDGSVVLILADKLTPEQMSLLESKKAQDSRQKLHVPAVDLSLKQPLNLSAVDKSLSGRVVGPKAANLGELNKLFPGRVSPAIALPFGAFVDQVNGYENSHWSQLQTLYRQYSQGEIDSEKLTIALEQLRQSVFNISVSAPFREKLERMMTSQFGKPGSYGIFIRSDTNAEDLPGFSGAGLYDTIPNVVGFEKQFSTIPRVWASILSPRAISWRANLLDNPENIFPSVLLMKSMPSEKSGVLVTTDLVNRQKGLTVSTAWGVGGAVAGEPSETLILLPNGEVQMVSEAKAPWQRILPLTGGIEWSPAKDGAVLTAEEQLELRKLAVEVNEKYHGHIDSEGTEQPWDIEFGFIGGKLTLFQIRPLVERRLAKTDEFLHHVLKYGNEISQPIQLDKKPYATINKF